MKKVFLTDLSLVELENICQEWGFEKYRAQQILHGIYQEFQAELGGIKNIPGKLLQLLSERTDIHDLEVAERASSPHDQSVKYLYRLSDREFVESVWMPQKGFRTICLSTQVGCPLKCVFCASGQVKFQRNLEPHEIVGQVLFIVQDQPDHQAPSHIVFMGMGEPLLNFENLLKTVRILKEPWGFGIGARRITISTAGYIPGILKWAEADQEFHQVRLSISLHSTQDDARSRIMPINRQYPLSELKKALETYHEKTGRRVTLEYLILKNINDSDQNARDLRDWVQDIAHSVNVIEYNEVDGTGLERSPRGEAFVEKLLELGIRATYRRSKGRDIEAACGQLRSKFVHEHVA